MNNGVLDASAAAAVLSGTQTTNAAQQFLTEIEQWRLLAPHIFRFELVNFFLVRSRRRGAAPDEFGRRVRLLMALNVRSDTAVSDDDFDSIVRLARAEELSLFDANYLHLALQRSAVLISKDAGLLAAAERRNVEVRDVR